MPGDGIQYIMIIKFKNPLFFHFWLDYFENSCINRTYKDRKLPSMTSICQPERLKHSFYSWPMSVSVVNRQDTEGDHN